MGPGSWLACTWALIKFRTIWYPELNDNSSPIIYICSINKSLESCNTISWAISHHFLNFSSTIQAPILGACFISNANLEVSYVKPIFNALWLWRAKYRIHTGHPLWVHWSYRYYDFNKMENDSCSKHFQIQNLCYLAEHKICFRMNKSVLIKLWHIHVLSFHRWQNPKKCNNGK